MKAPGWRRALVREVVRIVERGARVEVRRMMDLLCC